MWYSLLIHNKEREVNLLSEQLQVEKEINLDLSLKYRLQLETNKEISDKSFQDHLIIQNLNEKVNKYQVSLKTSQFKQNENGTIPIVILTCNRPDYLNITIHSLLRIRKNSIKNPIFISHDCNDSKTLEMLENEFQKEIIVLRNPNRGAVNETYRAISRHYKWILGEMFDKLNYQSLIILEDDLKVSLDFIDYFDKMKVLLYKESSLFCVSAWNDNGKAKHLNPDRTKAEMTFKRTDFFPGLGWMLLQGFWREIRDNWPIDYWDDYLREKDVVKGRQCIQPEIPRVSNFGLLGATSELLYINNIKDIVSLDDNVTISYENFDIHQLSNEQYLEDFQKSVESSKIIQLYEIDMFGYRNQTLRIVYKDDYDFTFYANQFGLISDLREGVQRCSYHNK
ncbi:GlcNAc transferase [Tieghemostelium lacteum]|uniref:alpha-1,3-mannosyl-glycoprotein 2-beta-N-acetylglucosaminyltransferase n=1 Tax=Tieghemostelium lacteum TaxID=361077 RepID=A0A151ZKB7_TIELA|nr:GlcNAc transferase [Tieghemostelium lacteum]|eukprot:KYQ94438.1 GlcNAc transferase [Tieghemostelium lacteum]